MLPNFRKALIQNSIIYNGMKIYKDMRRLIGFGAIIKYV
jgi:hypothetical protein